MLVEYVDDMLIAWKDEGVQELVAKHIGVQVDLRVEASVTQFLGMCVERDKTTKPLQISNYPLLYSTVSRFVLSNVKTAASTVTSGVQIHWIPLKCVLRYLKGTRANGIMSSSKYDLYLLGFVNFDFTEDHFDRKSTARQLFQLAKGAISWRSEKQTIFSFSTSESKYVALSPAAREVIWLKSLAGDVVLAASGVVCLNEDNQTALQMTQEDKLTKT